MTIQSGSYLPVAAYSAQDRGTSSVGSDSKTVLTQNAVVKLPVGSVASTIATSSLSVARSGSAGTSIVTSSANFSGNVALSVSGLPSGVNYTMVPATFPGSGAGSLTIKAGASAKPGTYTVLVRTAAGGSAALSELTLVID